MTSKIHIDVATRALVTEADVPSGSYGFITWRRLLTETFRESGEIQPNETVTHVSIDTRGINYRIERK